MFYVYLDESFLIRNFKNQISSLVIDIIKCEDPGLIDKINIFIFTQISNLFKNLQYLNFGPSSLGYHVLPFSKSLPVVFSSTLLELHVVVDCYDDCLYLLDGRFNQLHTFYVTIRFSGSPSLTMMNNKARYS